MSEKRKSPSGRTRRGLRTTGDPPDLETLFSRLEIYVTSKAGKNITPSDRRLLQLTVIMGGLAYTSAAAMSAQASRSSLHELSEPLNRVIALLKHHENVAEVLIALGASDIVRLPSPLNLSASSDPQALDRALARHQALLRDFNDAPGSLEMRSRFVLAGCDDQEVVARYGALLRDLGQIALNLPPRPPRRGRGRPSTTGNLRVLVETLVEYWERTTGKPFAADWHKGEPLNDATGFVVETIRFIAPRRLRSLPRLTAKIINVRRRQKKTGIQK
jgi:hypothetical protein